MNSLIIRDNNKNWRRELIANGEIVFSHIRTIINTPEQGAYLKLYARNWHPEWQALLKSPWGMFDPEIDILSDNNNSRR